MIRKHLTSLLAVCLLLAAVSLPANALEYTFDGLSAGDFGTPTSDETVSPWEDPNVDAGKNSALIPPGFGSPSSYLPNSGEYLTPNLAAGGPLNAPALAASLDAESAGSPEYPASADAPAFTGLTEDLFYPNGHIGTLKIQAVGLTVKVYEGTGSASLRKGVGHFESTSVWDGNIALAGHNRGVNEYFGKIHTLETGDEISLTTKLGSRTYTVVSVAKVNENDTSMLEPTGANCITLLTCVKNHPDQRWCVRAYAR